MTDSSRCARIHLKAGQAIDLLDSSEGSRRITCDDIAKLAYSIYTHRSYYELRHDLRIDFSRDLCGSGVQGLYISKNKNPYTDHIFDITFDQTTGDDFYYESDLIVDRGKDYEPTTNLGIHKFGVIGAAITIKWDSPECLIWQVDSQKLNQPRSTLAEWASSGLFIALR